MLDLKKILTKLTRMYVVQEVNIGSVELEANGAGAAQGSIAKAGYTPIGIVGIRKSGAAHNSVVLARWNIGSGDMVYVGLNNTASVARTATDITVSVLYRLGGGTA